MRKSFFVGYTIFVLFCSNLQAQKAFFESEKGNKENVMSSAYWEFWNDKAQAEIDENIEKHRKTDVTIKLDQIPPGTNIQIEQISHSFLFGGNIFLFGDFKTPEQNEKYENTFGTLFNAATVPFYWKTLEPVQGKPRYEAGSSYEYRRPPIDPIVDFCESRGINMNGHAIIYGMRRWGHPEWIPENRKKMEKYFEAHIKELAGRYRDKIQRWDVVNEPTDQANRGIMPDDYTYKSFIWAMKYFPSSVFLNINDSDMHWEMTLYRRYLEIVRNLIDRGVRIDQVGLQMHIFNPDESRRIAQGADILTPEKIYERLDYMSDAARPIHVSEVTVSAPDETEKGEAIQAEITRNLYRLWFSYPTVMGITWWNIVDGGAAPGEPSLSGIYNKEMQPKIVYDTLDQLINHEWKTKLIIKTDKDGLLKFRGFRGKYRVDWKDKSGRKQSLELNIE
ncbi:MAG: endo-1,4-beta-xylanase [Proteiniphilum sp.]|uniref:endo-1,4-beta-xylanase n=1 Tax=Proteiniphilum sp. TaxID=1926877 RepID=UPI002ABACF49|nr:endo-1,4-beta-xylanase [Proteiniphilum sp.]MDY9918725.1 endo-1,4-beta-xylanase [Proteiniphilum sp.]